MSSEQLLRSQQKLAEIRAVQTLPQMPASVEQYLPLEHMAKVLNEEDDEQLLTDGVAVSAQGELFVACETEFTGCTPHMLRWWFCEGCAGSAEYVLWHPGDHFSCQWSPGWHRRKGSIAGETHLVSEALGADIGGKAQSLRIQFKDPKVYGVDSVDGLAMCAQIGVYNAGLGGWLDVGHFIHFSVKESVAGFQLRSRFWLGHIDLPLDNRLRLCNGIVTSIVNTRLARSFAARFIDGRKSLFDLGVANYRHAKEEFAVLASFLADAYHRASAQSMPPLYSKSQR